MSGRSRPFTLLANEGPATPLPILPSPFLAPFEPRVRSTVVAPKGGRATLRPREHRSWGSGPVSDGRRGGQTREPPASAGSGGAEARAGRGRVTGRDGPSSDSPRGPPPAPGPLPALAALAPACAARPGARGGGRGLRARARRHCSARWAVGARGGPSRAHRRLVYPGARPARAPPALLLPAAARRSFLHGALGAVEGHLKERLSYNRQGHWTPLCRSRREVIQG